MLNRTSQLFRRVTARSFFFSNQVKIAPGESTLPIYTTEMAPILKAARADNNELETITNNSDLNSFMLERVPYMVLPQLKFKMVFFVVDMEFFRESKVLKMTCLDVSKNCIFIKVKGGICIF